jgi:hypothetical protein
LPDESEDKGFSWKVLIAVMTVCVSLTGVVTTWINKKESNETAVFSKVLERLEAVELQLKNEQAQNSELRNQTIEFQQKILLLSGENLKLKLQLGESITRRRLYQEFIDAFPFPFWIKEMGDDGQFRAWIINNSYVYKYGISKERYVGATDADVWGDLVADEFGKADKEVYDNKSFMMTKEMVPEFGPGSTHKPAHGWKFAVKIGVDQMGVAGLVVLDSDEQIDDETE